MIRKLAGKRALVTGASQGIGAAVAEGLIEAGADVCMHYFQSDAVPRQLAERAKALGQRALVVRADLRQEDEAGGAVKSAVDFLGGLDVLINNAGSLVARRQLEEVDVAYWDEVLRLNLTTMMLVTRAAARELVKNSESSIVNVASLAGRKGGHGGSLVYSSAKGAVLTWTRALSAELGPRGVRVNAVAPGLVLGTRFHDTHTTKASAAETVRSIPLGRGGTAQDVARAVLYLASEYDGFITGATLDINGGVYCA
ncbi:MAG: SDR family oxidoreductase [Myxococcales bacterium]|nr:MAG: SDR family oxidoreductase [Myxococcales bacterium]